MSTTGLRNGRFLRRLPNVESVQPNWRTPRRLNEFMITNLVATVSIFLTTNVSEIYPTHQEFDSAASSEMDSKSGIYGGCCVIKTVQDENPTNKIVRTSVTWTRRTSLVINGDEQHFDECSNYSVSDKYFDLKWCETTNRFDPAPRLLGKRPYNFTYAYGVNDYATNGPLKSWSTQVGATNK